MPIHIAGSPTATHIACFSAMVKDEPEDAYDVTLDAESTITSPSATRSPALPSSR
jgi:hypothetical protein